MRRYVRVLLVALLLSPFIVSSAAVAETASPNTSASSSSSSSTSSDAPLTAQQKADLAKRLADRKAELKTKLTAVEQAKLKVKCVAAQGIIAPIGARLKGVETSRGEVYKNIVDGLTKLSAKLKEKQIDTTKLDDEITTLKAKITTFNNDLVAYKQAVADLKDQDCVSDPVAFKASIDAARTARDKVSKDAADIRAYLTDTVKPTLKDLRSQVEAKKSSTDPGTGSQ